MIKKKRMPDHKVREIVLTSGLTILVAISFVIYIFYIHGPAMESTIVGCNMRPAGLEEQKYVTAGYTTFRMNTTTNEIIDYNIDINTNLSENIQKIAYKHELCHLEQAQRNSFKMEFCSAERGKAHRYFNEVECYFRQYM